MTIIDVAIDDRDAYKLLTVIEAAKYLALSRGAIYNLLNTGALKSIHIGRARRIPLGELQRFVAGCLGQEPHPAAWADARTVGVRRGEL